jgi:PII-like signaling protein
MENLIQSGILRIYISSTDHINQKPLYEYLVFEAKRGGIAGATVLKGILGYGASSVIHSYKYWEISDKVPLIIELVDELTKITAFYKKIHKELETMKYGCLVTLEETNVLLYKSGQKRMFEI